MKTSLPKEDDIMPGGIRYNIGYNHKRKEVMLILQIGSQPPVEFVMGAESFIQDLDFITHSEGLKKAIDVIRVRKDLPIDYDFGIDGSDFDNRKWEEKMEG